MTNRYIVTSAYNAICSDKLRYLGCATNRSAANAHATRVHYSGGRALVHDTTTGLIIRDTGKCLGQVWGGSSRKGQKSPQWNEGEQ